MLTIVVFLCLSTPSDKAPSTIVPPKIPNCNAEKNTCSPVASVGLSQSGSDPRKPRKVEQRHDAVEEQMSGPGQSVSMRQEEGNNGGEGKAVGDMLLTG